MIMRGISAYPASLVRGSRPVVAHRIRRSRGLGQPNAPGCMSSSDFYASIGPLANCDPRDVACVLCNQQKSDAVSNLVDSGCVVPGTPVNFSCDTSQNAINAFQSNNPLAVNATVGTGSSAFVATGPTVTMQPQGQSAANWWGGPAGTVAGNPPGSTSPSQTGANPGNGVSQQNVQVQTTHPFAPRHYPPPSPKVVNPSPPGTLTATGTSQLNPNSLLSQANGLSVSTTPVSTGDWFTDPTQEIISGLPNWALLVMGGAGLFFVVNLASKR